MGTYNGRCSMFRPWPAQTTFTAEANSSLRRRNIKGSVLIRTDSGFLDTKRKNPRNREISRIFLELLGRFELPTSSLPSVVEPSSPCCIRLFGGFLSKKDEVAACLFHCFHPRVSPCGSRCGSNNFQDANEGRTSDSGKPSRCALSRS